MPHLVVSFSTLSSLTYVVPWIYFILLFDYSGSNMHKVSLIFESEKWPMVLFVGNVQKLNHFYLFFNLPGTQHF